MSKGREFVREQSSVIVFYWLDLVLILNGGIKTTCDVGGGLDGDSAFIQDPTSKSIKMEKNKGIRVRVDGEEVLVDKDNENIQDIWYKDVEDELMDEEEFDPCPERRFAKLCRNKKIVPKIEIMGRELSTEYDGLHIICFARGKYGHMATKRVEPGVVK
ncbi:hypothetical protein RJT34_33570 [Clitoria ternatea]|uniref:Uncharacterized protein n=1 Tax=Clitoria ternatea TaxID=43366 RepID=A0AAN9I5N4_CLITE